MLIVNINKFMYANIISFHRRLVNIKLAVRRRRGRLNEDIIKRSMIKVCWMTRPGALVFGEWLLAGGPFFQPDPAVPFKNSQ